ncbi:hypothetical protein [Nocardia paucivorans]|uniref:hypothetical protein n=1 Tax=Nocardia paucivorans TaxID=114259 RepID=UPI0012F8DF50|nr:hypothetical protein [Nocardia paucivorans]
MRIGYTSVPDMLEPDGLIHEAPVAGTGEDDTPAATLSPQGGPFRAQSDDRASDTTSERKVFSNIADCSADPGILTLGQAYRAHDIHRYCSAECQVRRRAVSILTATERPGFAISPGLPDPTAD